MTLMGFVILSYGIFFMFVFFKIRQKIIKSRFLYSLTCFDLSKNKFDFFIQFNFKRVKSDLSVEEYYKINKGVKIIITFENQSVSNVRFTRSFDWNNQMFNIIERNKKKAIQVGLRPSYDLYQNEFCNFYVDKGSKYINLKMKIPAKYNRNHSSHNNDGIVNELQRMLESPELRFEQWKRSIKI